MDKIKSLWEEQRALFLVVAVLLIVVLVFAIINPTWILYLVVGGIVLVVLWLTMDTVLKARKRKRQENLDERIAAKEGIDDRKREWLTWSQELRKHGIDRYELPFYLLVGEPQSGKSILLQNSGLNFPLGQTKLSGPGGTRGCDWWFTEEAVVLDLAGRLFTHEGGASDATEWEAFLGLLAGYRPLSPANGILLVIPCDSLLQDSAEETKRKATRIQESLTTLVDKLEAQLPIYVVLTKADKIFGFAESVHRLDSERRRQMFGWSRSADDFEKPFSMPEFRKAFDRIRTRAHLIRAGALSSAQVPDALPEIDRLFAFPEELGALAAPLESYMERIFSESALVERLFFRGLYLTSGLQQGAPIAQACAALMGSSSEADSRNLEGLFTKQRSYFIHDFIQRRVFGERGLVRPTSSRVHRSRKMAFMGYGTAAAIMVLGAIWFGYSTMTAGSPMEYEDYRIALGTSQSYTDQEPEERDLKGLLMALGAIHGAVESKLPSVEQAFTSNTSDFESLHSQLCEKDLTRLVRQAAEEALSKATHQAPAGCSYNDLDGLTQQLDFLLGSMPDKDGQPMGGFGLGDEITRSVLSDLLSVDPELAPYFTESKNSAGEVTGPGVFAKAIAIHAELEGILPISKWDSSSGTLTKAAGGLLGLYTDFLTDGDFGGGGLPAPEATYELERLALVYRSESVLSRSKVILSGEEQVDCAEVIQSKIRFDKAVNGLRVFVKDYVSVAQSKFWDEYADVNTRLSRVTGQVGLEPPLAWSSFRDSMEQLFNSGSQGPLLVSWKMLGPDQAPSGRIAIKPRAVTRAFSRLAYGLGMNPADVLKSGKDQSNSSKPTWGALSLVPMEKVHEKIGVNEVEMAKIVQDCSAEILNPATDPNPVVLLELANSIWTANANHDGQRAKSLIQQMRGLQAGYVAYYNRESTGYKALANSLGLSGDNDTSARQYGLHLSVAEHLFEMYALLLAMDSGGPEFKAWRAALKFHIDPMLADAIAGSKVTSGEEFVAGPSDRYLGALATAWRTGEAFKSQLIDLLDRYHSEKRVGLEFEWEEIAGFDEIAEDLREHLQSQVGLTGSGYYSGEYGAVRSAWLRDTVDPLLVDRLDGFDKVVREYWRESALVDSDDLREVAKEISARLGTRLGTFVRRGATGAPDFGTLEDVLDGIYAALGEEPEATDSLLPGTRRAFGDLGSIGMSVALSNVNVTLAEDDIAKVLELSNSLRGSRSSDVSVETKAKGLVDIIYALRRARSEVPGDVGKHFLEASLLELHRALHADLAKAYAIEFQTRVLSAHRDTLQSRLFQVDAESSLATVKPLDMQALLKAVKGLREKYMCGEPNASWTKPDLELRLHPFRVDLPRAEWNDFLFALTLMFKDQLGDALEDYVLLFKLAPDTSRNFWSNNGTLKNGTSLGFWWPLGKQLSRDVRDSTSEPFEVSWRLGSDKTFYTAWNNSVSPPADNAGLDLTLKGAFAPLALAWHYGEQDESDSKRFLLNIVLDAVSVDKEGIPVKMTVPDGFPDLPPSSIPFR